MSAALARFLSRSMLPTRIGTGFPAQALLRFRVDVPTHDRAPLQGFVPRMESVEVVVRLRPAPAEFPSRVFSSAALAHGFLPGPSSLALSTTRAFAREVLATDFGSLTRGSTTDEVALSGATVRYSITRGA